MTKATTTCRRCLQGEPSLCQGPGCAQYERGRRKRKVAAPRVRAVRKPRPRAQPAGPRQPVGGAREGAGRKLKFDLSSVSLSMAEAVVDALIDGEAAPAVARRAGVDRQVTRNVARWLDAGMTRENALARARQKVKVAA